jgi:hypothetical protein
MKLEAWLQRLIFYIFILHPLTLFLDPVSFISGWSFYGKYNKQRKKYKFLSLSYLNLFFEYVREYEKQYYENLYTEKQLKRIKKEYYLTYKKVK